MDFSNFNTVDGSEEGRFLHLRHPSTNALLYEGEGDNRIKVGIWLRGIESKTVLEAINADKRRATKGEDADEEFATVSALVIRFQGLHRGKKELTTGKDDLRWFFDQSSLLVQAVLDFTSKPANFLPAASKD